MADATRFLHILSGTFRKLVTIVLPSLMAFISATLAAGLVMWGFGFPPVQAFGVLLGGAFGDAYSISETLLKATPLIFTGLAVALAFQAGIWNIGADGQFISGAVAATALAAVWPGASWPVLVLAALLLGACWAWLAAALREWRGVSEVITTIMLNVIAVQILSYALHGPLQEAAGTYPQSDRLSAVLQLDRLFTGLRLHSGLLLALLVAVLAWLLLFRMGFGFRLRAIGQNRTAARVAGIRVPMHVLAAMAISGALAGLGGVVELTGVTYRLYENFSPGYGFTAIAVALLARLHPLGVLPAAVLFGALETGARAMQRTLGISPVLAEVIQAMVILFVVLYETPWFRQWLSRRWQPAARLDNSRKHF